MATAYQNLSAYDPTTVPDASAMKIGIVVAEWNSNITEPLLKGAIDTLERHGVKESNIMISRVPGTFELTFGACQMAKLTATSLPRKLDAIITLGCVVRGDTPHFDYVCQGVTQGMTLLNTQFDIPFIFGVLTTDTMQQSLDRAGGIHGNKGDECAVTAIKMIQMARELRQSQGL